jgi:hypothetical protein
MDHEQFDDLTRTVVGEGGTRRALLRLLVSGVLGGLAARLGLDEVTAAQKAKKRTRQADTSPSATQAESKRHKMHSKKHNKNHKINPKGTGDIPLCRLDCETTGRKCCPDGSCVLIGDCCPGMKHCGVTSCIPEGQCCPGDDSAGCQPCEVEVCNNGEWVCQSTDECGPRSGDGY